MPLWLNNTPSHVYTHTAPNSWSAGFTAQFLSDSGISRSKKLSSLLEKSPKYAQLTSQLQSRFWNKDPRGRTLYDTVLSLHSQVNMFCLTVSWKPVQSTLWSLCSEGKPRRHRLLLLLLQLASVDTDRGDSFAGEDQEKLTLGTPHLLWLSTEGDESKHSCWIKIEIVRTHWLWKFCQGRKEAFHSVRFRKLSNAQHSAGICKKFLIEWRKDFFL